MQAFLRGFIKAAHDSGVHPLDLARMIKTANAGVGSALMGALPGAAAGGYLAYDRAQERQKKEPTSISPHIAAGLGALGGGGLGALAGMAAGSLGYERGAIDSSDYHKALLEHLSNSYMQA
jgi:hypothetical protein